jgi:WhiB family transcriptional regulator, redox-sensing transcriptional regulator
MIRKALPILISTAEDYPASMWAARAGAWTGPGRVKTNKTGDGVRMTALDNRAGWWARAACASADPELFFPISYSGPALRQVAQAKAICARCPIQRECLRYALDAGPIQGVWGGMTEEERRRFARRERRARVRQVRHTGARPRVPETARSR